MLRTRSRLINVLIILTGINSIRIASFGLFIAAYYEEIPHVFMIPGLGDFLIGITAPLLAFRLWKKRGLTVWNIASIWHAVALIDLLVAIALNYLTPGPFRLSSRWLFALSIPVPLLPLCHILVLMLLRKREVVKYYTDPIGHL